MATANAKLYPEASAQAIQSLAIGPDTFRLNIGNIREGHDQMDSNNLAELNIQAILEMQEGADTNAYLAIGWILLGTFNNADGLFTYSIGFPDNGGQVVYPASH